MFTISDRIVGLCVGRLLAGNGPAARHPQLIIQSASGNIFNNAAVSENYSDQIIDELHWLLERKEPVPVDRLLGQYSPSTRSVTIYIKAIELFAKQLGLVKEHVEFVVRLHEYGHAIFHIGSESTHPINNIDQFILERSTAFGNHTEAVHEWIAQHMAYSGLCNDSLESHKSTFLKMMDNQPTIYRIDQNQIEDLIASDKVKSRPQLWTYLLEAIRDETLDPFNPDKGLM